MGNFWGSSQNAKRKTGRGKKVRVGAQNPQSQAASPQSYGGRVNASPAGVDLSSEGDYGECGLLTDDGDAGVIHRASCLGC